MPTPTAPALHVFVGWYTEAENGTKVDTDYVFEGEEETVTVYAHYKLSKDNGLWVGSEKKGTFSKDEADQEQIWAYGVTLEEGKELEIWYNGDLLTDIKYNEYSTAKITMTADKKLALV